MDTDVSNRERHVELIEVVRRQVPHVATLESCSIEHAAGGMELPTNRVDRAIVLVWIDGRAHPFVGMGGPSVSRVANVLTRDPRRLRILLEDARLPVAPSLMVRSDERAMVQAFAEDNDWAVALEPATGVAPVPAIINQASDFKVAWGSMGTLSGDGPPAGIRVTAGRRFLTICVVEDEVIAGVDIGVPSHAQSPSRASRDGSALDAAQDRPGRTQHYRARQPAGPTSPGGAATATPPLIAAMGEPLGAVAGFGTQPMATVTDVSDELTSAEVELALRAVRAVPGLAYGQVCLATLGDGSSSTRELAIADVRPSPTAVAQFPSEGTPRPVAREILSYYLATAGETSVD